MEIVIVVAIWTVMVKRGVEDIWHTARGGTPPRLAAAKARRSTGAAGRYWSTLWDDTFDDMLSKHTARRARRQANPSTPRPRGAATQFFAGWLQDGRRAAGRKWESGWTRADEKRREKATRPRPGQDTVPGEVVPNAQDEFMCRSCGKRPAVPSTLWCSSCTPSQDGGGDRPQDGDGPEPHVVPDEDGRTDLRFGDDPTDPTGTKRCPECHGTVLVDGEVCLSCRDRQEQRNQHRDDQDDEPPSCPKCLTTMTTAPNIGDPISYDGKGIYRCPSCDYKIRRSPTDDSTQEGPTTMTTTIPTGEVVGLSDTIKFCEGSAEAFRAQVHATELTIAATAAGGDTSQGAAKLATAMELCTAAAAAMDEAAAEYKSHVGIQEQYNANPGAGDRDFILAGQ
jgi:hypothetical protein